MNKSITWNIVGLLVATSLVGLINTDNELITNLNLSDGAMSALKLVSYLGAIVLTWYNGTQIYSKRKSND